MVIASVALLVAAVGVSRPTPALGATRTLAGVVESGGTPLVGYEVTLYLAMVGSTPVPGLINVPQQLGTATTDASGAFSLDYDLSLFPDDDDRVVYVVARSGLLRPVRDVVTLTTVLGREVPDAVTVNPRTTVATAYSLAQFLDGAVVIGPSPGVPNGASMAANLADPVTGAIGEVLDSAPNGSETTTRETFNAVANMVAACVADDAACEALRTAATPAGGSRPGDTLTALRNIVVQPGHEVLALFAVSQSGPTPYAPARAVPPAAWTLALRFVGDGQTLNGPGNFVLDHEGTMWVAVNYTYAPPGQEACASGLLARFAPDGSFVPGSPYSGGGLSGAGYGIARDRWGTIWVSNFGFAAEECAEQPPHNTLSRFTPDGRAISPPEGDAVAGVSWPQGIEFSPTGDLWVANCNDDSVTVVEGGDVDRARVLRDLGVSKPFDVAFGSDGNAYVTGTASDNVAVVAPDGTPVAGSPLAGYHRPMGITASSTGELWIANSGLVDLPCPTKQVAFEPPPSLGYIDPATGERATFTGGGLVIPWGVSVDGNDNVWVSNFGGERLSAFCGRDDSPHCPPGVGKGDPLSPDVTGYFFEGLTRSTATATDTAGNVWVTNNWKIVPQEINPGGYEVVVFLGLAGPVEVPAPQPPPSPSPPVDPPPSPPAPPVAVPAQPVATAPRFTG